MTVLGDDLRAMLFGYSQTNTNPADNFNSYTVPAPVSSQKAASLGPYAISIAGHVYPVDTSFEPYRREAFRHRTVPAQRQSINMTNIVGQGTVNSEGLWRREQADWSMGAGQQFLDRKGDSQEARFLNSKGVDVFNALLQATLLPDTYRKDTGTATSSLLMSRCNDYVITADKPGGTLIVKAYSGTNWSTYITATFTGTAPTTVYSMDTNNAAVYLATDNGIWYGSVASGALVFALFAANDITTGYTGGYDMVSCANDQLIASKNNRLYAFQPRSSTGYPNFGAPPSIADISSNITTISLSGTTATVTTKAAHGLSVGQPIVISGSTAAISLHASTAMTLSGGIATVTASGNHGLSSGQTVTIAGSSNSGLNGTYSVINVPSSVTFTIAANTTTAGGTGGTATGSGNYGYNSAWAVATVPTPTTFTFSVGSTGSLYTASGQGGTVIASTVPDMLTTHTNPSWVWSSATAGETQVYFSGYVKGANSNYGGCIYRSNLQGSSTTAASGIGTISGSSVVSAFSLNTPVQALPMSPDEYPTVIRSYLNFLFIGTNRGIRMAQTLSIYDPTATATGDLKSGPIIPNILSPLTSPVSDIIGDGRFVWFTWNNYDLVSTGLGRLDLSTFIAGDPLTPAYASDIMVGTSTSPVQGKITSLDWDPATNVPIMAVAGHGVYAPYATNTTGVWNVSKYVASGFIKSGIYTYGIPDKKIPIFFDYGVAIPGGSAQASITIDEHDPDSRGEIFLTPVYSNSETEVSVPGGISLAAENFTTTMYLNSDSGQVASPILYRWTTKAWPAVASETTISVVIQLYSVNRIDGLEVFTDPYAEYIYLDTIRRSQTITQYQEGPIVADVIIDSLDWLPHKRRDNYENGFEGDCVVYLKTIGGYSYYAPNTN
jgi:hypothetical protein